MKVKINIDTQSAATRLVNIASTLSDTVYLTDGANMRVSAKSLMGVLYASFDFTEVWLETENDHYMTFKDFIEE